MKRLLLLLVLAPALAFSQEKPDNRVSFYLLVQKQKQTVRSIFSYLDRGHPDSVLFLCAPEYLKTDVNLLKRLREASAETGALKDSCFGVIEMTAYSDDHTTYKYTLAGHGETYFRAEVQMSLNPQHPRMLGFSYIGMDALKKERKMWSETKDRSGPPPPPPPPPGTYGKGEQLPVQDSRKGKSGGKDDEKIFSFAEQAPEFPGGEAALMKFLGQNIHYPEIERDNGVSGMVVLSFVVNKEGTIHDIRILRGVKGGPGLGEEAIRVILMMPDWKPGTMNGKKVMVQYNLPVSYKLK
ncbi:MAG: energy transducer TonB [Bacteroidia bacterium]